MEALKSASTMLAELRTSSLSPVGFASNVKPTFDLLTLSPHCPETILRTVYVGHIRLVYSDKLLRVPMFTL